MPSDCQCSACGACDCQSTKIVEKKISNKEATEIIEKLEEKNKLLEEKNESLLKGNERKKVSKKGIIRALLKKLNDLVK
jgi:hypothetical protein